MLQSKEQQAAEMRRKLGIGPMQQIKSTFENLGKSETYVLLINLGKSAWYLPSILGGTIFSRIF